MCPYVFCDHLIFWGSKCQNDAVNAHLIEEQLTRAPQSSPRLEITRKPETIFDYEITDFVVHDYAPHPPIKAPVAV